MRKRKPEPVATAVAAMPEELRRRPMTAEQYDFWIGDDVEPAHWGVDPKWNGHGRWRETHALANWRRARGEWFRHHRSAS